MSLFVLDASVAMNWVLFEQVTDRSLQLFAKVRDGGAVVPAIWSMEIANVLARGERTGEMTRFEVDDALALLNALPIEFDEHCATIRSGEVLSLMRSSGLKAYDALYLELAQRRKLPIATFDRQMYKACQRAGIAVAVEIPL